MDIQTTEVRAAMTSIFKTRLLKAAVLLGLAAALAFCCVTAQAAVYYTYAGYSFLIDSGNACLHSYDGTDADLYIPESILTYPVTAIEDFAFLGRSEFNSLGLQYGANLKTIGSYAFARCSGFSTAEIPYKVETVGDSAFQENPTLKKAVYDGKKITAINRQTFYDCPLLSEVVLPPSLTSIGDYAFAQCPSLAYLELQREVTEIGEGAFEGDTGLTLGVWYDSYAFEYADENDLRYVFLDGIGFGDADGDGVVSINDVTCIQRHLAELGQLEGICSKTADANADKKVDIYDAGHIQMYLAEYEVKLGR